jgi:hypothetical protein
MKTFSKPRIVLKTSEIIRELSRILFFFPFSTYKTGLQQMSIKQSNASQTKENKNTSYSFIVTHVFLISFAGN